MNELNSIVVTYTLLGLNVLINRLVEGDKALQIKVEVSQSLECVFSCLEVPNL